MKNFCFLLLIVLLVLSGCTQVDKTAEANAALAARIATEIWNNGTLDVIDEIMADNYVRHNPESMEINTIEGPDALKEYVSATRAMYPDFKLEVHNSCASGDMVASNWTVTGTHSEAGKEVTVNGLVMTRYENGKAVEEWMSFDTQGLMQQLSADSEEEMSMK